MKKTCTAMALVAVLLNAVTTVCAADPIKESLARTPAAEMPAKAAELVARANVRHRETMTIEVMNAGLKLNPSAAASFVSAISKNVPAMAAIAAGTAAQAQPKQAIVIARAAADAAPAKAAEIVAAVCWAVPREYKKIAQAVAQVVPGSGKQILAAVASVFPELKAGIDSAVSGYGFNEPSIATVLDSVKPPMTGQTTLSVVGEASVATVPPQPLRGPTLAPPYVPYSGTSPNVTPSGSGTVPRGQRNYAAP